MRHQSAAQLHGPTVFVLPTLRTIGGGKKEIAAVAHLQGIVSCIFIAAAKNERLVPQLWGDTTKLDHQSTT